MPKCWWSICHRSPCRRHARPIATIHAMVAMGHRPRERPTRTTRSASMIELIIQQRRRDLGSFEVGRVLPFAKRRMIGPYIFFDRMGPKDIAAGLPREADVRPHPHIGLSTITYLFDGEIMHRATVGSEQAVRPGEVNSMTAGRGITH